MKTNESIILKNAKLLRHYTLQRLNKYPQFYFPLIHLRKYRHLMVSKDTDITIEGYPRSANSFSVRAFVLAQELCGNNVKIAHHLHAPAQIKKSIKLNIPTVVLIRKPEEAVISVVIKRPFLSLSNALGNYIRFYSSIYNLKKFFFVAAFDEVTKDFSDVTNKINKFFQTNFAVFEHNKSNSDMIFNDMVKRGASLYEGDETKYALPTSSKYERKKELEKEICFPKNEYILSKAKKIYNSYMN